MKLFKYILLFFLLAFLSYQNSYAQSDSTEINQSGYFLTFVKKVYLNPTVYLRTQDFKENTNLSFVALPDLASEKTNASSGFEKGLQKVLRFLMQSDGGVRFYFNPDSTTHPFRFWYSDNLHCKFKQADKDSIDYYLNHYFADGNISMTNALRFETTIDKALDYIEKCLTANPQACGEEPQNETTEINTKPLSVSLHNRANSKYDIDVKQYEKLESNYAKAFDIYMQQDWFAPAKLLVANETAEPVALAIHSNEGDFLKQNIKIEVLKTHALLPIDQASTEDSLFFSLPSTLPAGDPVEVIVKYKSPKDSNTYTVGFFMVNVMEREVKNLVLIPANGFVISNNFKDSVETELEKIYGQASVDFNVTIETGLVFPSEYPTSIEIESSGLFSNYAPGMRDYVGEVQDLNEYESENYYLIIGLESTELQGYMPRARNIGFIFKSAVNKPKVIAHEIGHGAFHFRHIFAEEELGEESHGSTQNIMDYVQNPKDLYLHQWNFIKDPAFVSWFGGDDEDGAYTSCDISLLEPFKINNRFYFIKNNGKYISLPETIKSVTFSTMDRYVISGTEIQSDYLAPVGAMIKFTDENGKVYSNNRNGNFYDENDIIYPEDFQDYTSINYAITCFIDVDGSAELAPFYFLAPSIQPVSSSQYPGGLDSDKFPVIFGLNYGTSYVDDFMALTPEEFMAKSREGLNLSNPNFIKGNSVTFSSDGIPFKFYRPSEIINGIALPPENYTFKQFTIYDLFRNKTKFTNEEITRFLVIKNIRKNELKAIANCIQSETYEDSKISLLSLEMLAPVACTTSYCNDMRWRIHDLRTRTVYTMINQAFAESSNVSSTLDQMLTDQKTATDFGEYLSHIETCDMYGIPWETRKNVLNKIIYDDGSWNVNDKSIMAMLIKTSVDDDGNKLLEFIKADNYARLAYIIGELDEVLDWNDAADAKDALAAMESLTRHVIKHKSKYAQSTEGFTFSRTTYSTIVLNNSNNLFPPATLNVPEKTYDFVFPYVEIPLVIGVKESNKIRLPDIDFGDKYYGSVGGYEIQTTSSQPLYPIVWDETLGKFTITQHFKVSEILVGPVFTVPGTQFPDIEIYNVNYTYHLNPYDIVDVVIGDNYGALDLPKGTIIQLPVITAFFLQQSILETNYSANFRQIFNLVEIGAAILTLVSAPLTLGGSLVVFAGVMASIDYAIQSERNNLATAAEYYNDYYKTWDNVKIISDLAMGATAIYQLGKYALKQGRSFVIAIAINRAVRNTKLPLEFGTMSANSKNFTRKIIFSVQKGIALENTFQLLAGSDQWLLWSQYPKVILNGEEFAVVGSKFFSKAAVESMVPSGLGGSGIPPSVINNVLANGEHLSSAGKIRYNLGNVFIWTESNSTIVRTIRVNKVNSISDLATNPHLIFGYLDTELDALLTQSGWTKGTYGGTSDAVMYFKQSNAGRSEIVFNYGGGRHSGGGAISNTPLYYKLEGPEFKYIQNGQELNKRIRIIDLETYPPLELQKAKTEGFKLVDGPTGTIIQ